MPLCIRGYARPSRKCACARVGPLLVYEAALIFETGGERLLDAVAVVDAPATDRIERVRKRDNVSEKQVRERMEHQLPRKELIEPCRLHH